MRTAHLLLAGSCPPPAPTPAQPPTPPPPPPPGPPQIEEDTDRDRYMSPLEAKAYGLIDHIVGGDEAVFKVRRRACTSAERRSAAGC